MLAIEKGIHIVKVAFPFFNWACGFKSGERCNKDLIMRFRALITIISKTMQKEEEKGLRYPDLKKVRAVWVVFYQILFQDFQNVILRYVPGFFAYRKTRSWLFT